MSAVEPEIILPREQKTLLLHMLTFPEVLASKKPVSDACGYLVAGPDRRGANALHPAKLWPLWRRDVAAAGMKAPASVRDWFARTSHLTQAPKGDDLTIYSSGIAPSIFEAEIISGGSVIDLEALTGGTAAPTPAAPPCSGKLANPPRFATSFSGMEEFLQCPLKFAASKYYKITKFEETEAIKWGNRVHKTAENYLLNAKDGGSRPVEVECLPLVKRYCDFFLASGADLHVEKEMCFTEDLKPCGWRDWSTVFFRGKADLMAIKNRKLTVVDIKTGKTKSDLFQIEVMVALASLYYGDQFDEADGKLIFVKEPDPRKALVGLTKPILKDDIPKIWEKVFGIINRMRASWESATWRAEKNGLCRQYCANVYCVHNGFYKG